MFSTSVGALKAALKKGALALERRHSSCIPVLNMARVSIVSEDLAQVTVTDLDVQIWIDVTIEGGNAGKSLCLPVRAILRLLMAISETTKVTVSLEGILVCLRWSGGEARFEALPVADFPDLPMASGWHDHKWTEVAGSFYEATVRAAPAISTEDTRYYLTGLCLDLTANPCVVATDGHRLATLDIRDCAAWEKQKERLIIPKRLLEIWLKAFKGQPFKMGFRTHLVTFQTDGLTLTGKLIDGTYPEWRRVMPTPLTELEVAISRSSFIQALNLINALGCTRDDRANATLIFDGRRLQVGRVGSFATQQIMVDVGECPFAARTVHISAHYLLTAARTARGDTLRLWIAKGAYDPIMLQGSDDGDNDRFMVMPMRELTIPTFVASIAA